MIVADHTKFGRLALARLCGLDEVAPARGRLRASPTNTGRSSKRPGVTIHVAPVDGPTTDGTAADGPPRADGP